MVIMNWDHKLLCITGLLQRIMKFDVMTHPSPSSVSVLHINDIGNVTVSVMEISLTLKAGDRIAHWEMKMQYKAFCYCLSNRSD